MRLLAVVAMAASLLQAQTATRPHILGVAHIALRVNDIDQARAFYKNFLGFAEPFQLTNADGSLALTFIKINDAQYIELFPGLKSDEDRLHHISIQTDNAERMRVYLASRGIKVPERVPKGRIGNLNFNVQDPDGHSLEIVEYAPDGWSMREKGKYEPGTRVSRHMLHVGIIVGNLDAAMRFYRDILGFTEIWRGSSDGKTLSWVNMKVPDGSDYVEFMLYSDLPAADKRGVVHHIALEVPDMTAAQAVLEARPYRKMYTKPLETHVGKNRRRQLNLFDPDGTRTELMEPVTVDGKPAPWSDAPAPGTRVSARFAKPRP